MLGANWLDIRACLHRRHERGLQGGGIARVGVETGDRERAKNEGWNGVLRVRIARGGWRLRQGTYQKVIARTCRRNGKHEEDWQPGTHEAPLLRRGATDGSASVLDLVEFGVWSVARGWAGGDCPWHFARGFTPNRSLYSVGHKSCLLTSSFVISSSCGADIMVIVVCTHAR